MGALIYAERQRRVSPSPRRCRADGVGGPDGGSDVACGPSGPAAPELRAGRETYGDLCSTCHGSRGQGGVGPGVGRFPRFAMLFLVYYLVLLTILISWIIRDVIDFDVLTESQEGLLLAFDHVMFIGVMTNIVFGVLAGYYTTARTQLANRVVEIGVNVGIVGFSIGLFSTTTVMKQIFAPIMGIALLIGLILYLAEIRSTQTSPIATATV